jgi:spore coat protein U-like protein
MVRAGIWVCTSLASVAQAQAPTATLGVRAYVPAACTASSLDYGVMDFGTHAALDNQIQVASTVGAGTIQITCVEGLSYTIAIDAGSNAEGAQRYLRGANGGRVQYLLYSDAQYTLPWNIDVPLSQQGSGVLQQIPLYGRIAPQATPVAGAYVDTVSVTVEW